MPTENESPRAAATVASKLKPSELLTRVRKRFALMYEAERENRRMAQEDMKFVYVPGAQWDKTVKDARGDRPCYEFNKTRIKEKRVINEMRANRPAGKVRAVEGGDKKTAEVMEGLGRNILQVSDFDTIADYAGVFQVGGGMGAWRIVTDYLDDSFDQDVCVKSIPNPFNLFWDPASTDTMHRDADDWCLIDSMSNHSFDDKYGDVPKTNFEGAAEFKDEAEWRDGEMTRVCEYHWKESYDKRLVLTTDGKVLDAADPVVETLPVERIKKTRVVKAHRIFMCIVSADKILTPATELKGKYHRFIVVHGEWLIIDGKPFWCGMTRYAKDAQRAYNVASTAVTETLATSPNSHYWVTETEAAGNTDQWNTAISQNKPFLIYTPDPKRGGAPPARTGGAELPIAAVQEAQVRDQELKDVMGVYDSSIGDKSNEHSGRAIMRRTEQGQIVNFDFPDNMGKAKQRTVEIINDLIPYYYDTARTIRVLGVDGSEEYIDINKAGIGADGLPTLLNDLTRGKYDVTVTIGPSYATQRQEAAEFYTQMAAQDPMLMQTAPDIVYRSVDLPYSDEVAERRAAMLPPEIQALAKAGKDVPPEVRKAQMILDAGKKQLDAQGQLLQKASGELAEREAKAKDAEGQFKVAKANFDADVATKSGDLAKREADLVLREARVVAKESAAATAAAAPRKVRKVAKGRRVNGELVVEMEEIPVDDGLPGGMPPAAAMNGAAPPMA